MSFREKYLKYKNKYFKLKEQMGGSYFEKLLLRFNGNSVNTGYFVVEGKEYQMVFNQTGGQQSVENLGLDRVLVSQINLSIAISFCDAETIVHYLGQLIGIRNYNNNRYNPIHNAFYYCMNRNWLPDIFTRLMQNEHILNALSSNKTFLNNAIHAVNTKIFLADRVYDNLTSKMKEAVAALYLPNSENVLWDRKVKTLLTNTNYTLAQIPGINRNVQISSANDANMLSDLREFMN
jgi:hypothetical protein